MTLSRDATDRRDWVDIFDWTTIFGLLSVFPNVYFWGCGLAHELFRISCPGSTVAVLLGILISIPLSATAGAYGSRLWWMVTAIASGTLFFFVLRLH
jgi:hypothetical protein